MKAQGIQSAACKLIVTAVVVLALAGVENGPGVRIARADGHCRQVSGSISANLIMNPNVSTGLVLGTVTGDLAGATMAT